MEEPQDTRSKMDAAATEAAKEFQASWTVAQLAPWLNKWYMSAGYKRLCKIILKAFGLRS